MAINRAFIGLLVLAAVAWLSFLGAVPLFDWDEINFAEASREMLALNDWQRAHINYELFWEKPPLFFWLQASSMSLFGVTEWAARMPNAMVGLLGLFVLFHVGRQVEDRRLGLYWALAWFGSFLPHLYAKSGLIDPIFNLAMFLGLYGALVGLWRLEGLRHPATASQEQPPSPLAGNGEHPASRASTISTSSTTSTTSTTNSPSLTGSGPEKSSAKPWWPLIGGGACIGLAVLAKGPVGLLLPGLAVFFYAAWYRFRHARYAAWGMLWLGTALLVCGTWFLADWWQHGPWFTESFLAYQLRLFGTPDAGHAGFPGYHLVVLLLGCFPSSILALAAMGKNRTLSRRADTMRTAMIGLLVVVLLVFGLVQSKIVHYSSFAYYPITFLAALHWHAIHRQAASAGRWMRVGLWTVSGLWASAVVGAFLLSRHPQWIQSWIKDPFATAQWQLVPPLSGWALLPAGILLVGIGLGLWAWRNGHAQRGGIVLFLSSALFLQSSLWVFAVPAERLSQGPVIAWWTALQGEDIYPFSTFRSYAPFFYARPIPPVGYDPAEAAARALLDTAEGGKLRFNRRRETDRTWLLWGDIDRDVWIVARQPQADWIEGIQGIERKDEEGGFVLLHRRATSTQDPTGE